MKLQIPGGLTEDQVWTQIQSAGLPRFSAAGVVAPQTHIRIFRGLNFALNDIARGLMALYPHKKNMAWMKGVSPFIRPILPLFAREGVGNQEVTLQNLAESPEKVVESLKKDTLFFILSEDDPALGRLFPIEPLLRVLQEKKIYAIVISHQNFLFAKDPLIPTPHSLFIHGVSTEISVGLSGGRSKYEPLIQGGMRWSDRDILTAVTQLQESKTLGSNESERKNKISEFESRVPGGGLGVFSILGLDSSQNRTWDRAVVSWQDMAASALCALLKEQNPELESWVLQNGGLFSLSPNHDLEWRGEEWLVDQGLNLADIRGLLVVSAELLMHVPNFVAMVERAVQDLRKLQGP